MSTKRNNELMKIADQVLQSGEATLLDRATGNISDSYNGQISALGVSIAMTGICPTLAIYYKGSNNETRAVDRRPILEVIARMIHNDALLKSTYPTIHNAESLLRFAINANRDTLKILQREIVNCAVALKQVVRTYNLVSQ